MLKSFVIVASMLLALHGNAQNSLRGSVYDAKDNQPLVGATILIVETKQYAVSDAFGRFKFDRVVPGDYTVRASFIGYSDVTEQIVVPSKGDLKLSMNATAVMTDAVVVTATRATDNTPTTFTNVDQQTIRKQNFGQDLPFLINWTPSAVTTSDAGTGIGYTGIRIRGSDATRVNITINGIPYNDSESLGTFWVNIPDIASSSQSIQIQRGVGTSTNGAGAFGATINLQTNLKNENAYGEVINSFGSFNTRRHTLSFGTGLLNDHWVIDGRVSKIVSDGFIDRASSDLQSYYFSGAYYANRTLIKFISFGGKERTYQSWYGVPESRLNNDAEAMQITASNEGWNDIQTNNLLTSGSRTFNPYLYTNQVDNYQQDHFQLHFSQQLNEGFTLNAALHYTPGKGYYEEYKYDDDFEDYGLQPVVIGDSVITSSDIIRRRWLDNHFYGFTYSLNFDKGFWNIVLGGGWNRYDGDHFGEIIWSQVASVPHEYRYYFNNGDKRDFNTFLKLNYQFTPKLNAFADLQYRTINYKVLGVENEQNQVNINTKFGLGTQSSGLDLGFGFNPKMGFTYTASDQLNVYASYGIAHKEPVRNDFVDNPNRMPVYETLRNLEAGIRFRNSRLTFHANYYLMDYRDQLVLTGELNDVGASIRTNVDKSYRTGIELDAQVMLSEKFRWNANLTLSRNKIKEFKEVLYDYGVDFNGFEIIERTFKDTDISFSPNVIGGSAFSFLPMANAEIALLTKYVGRQYLDNTSHNARSIDSYLVNDLRLSYSWRPAFMKEINFSFLVNNLFDELYESNGYTWGYRGGGEEFRENYYYPQAGRNFLGMISLRF